MEALERAAARLAEGGLEQALDALLEAWRAWRAPEIAGIIDVVSERLTAHRPPLPRRRLWHQAARDGSAADIGRLLAALHTTRWVGVHELDELYRRPDDPRIAMGLAQLLPRTLDAPQMLNIILRALRRTADPRGATLLRDFHAEELDRIADALDAAAPDPLPEAARALCARMRGPLDAGRETESSLLAAIHEEPDDDARRLVYADWLLDRGLPRGELIALQYRARERPLSPEERRRERELLRGHMVEWLGGLAPALTRPYGFERGFLAEATLQQHEAALARRDLPEWSTVHTLHAYMGEARLVDLVRSPALRSLRRLHGVSGALAAALAAGPPLPFEAMTIYLEREEPALGRPGVFPRLAELTARGPAEAFVWALERPLRRIVVLDAMPAPNGWLAHLPAAHPGLGELVFRYTQEQELVVRRVAGGWRAEPKNLPDAVLEQTRRAAPPGLFTGSG